MPSSRFEKGRRPGTVALLSALACLVLALSGAQTYSSPSGARAPAPDPSGTKSDYSNNLLLGQVQLSALFPGADTGVQTKAEDLFTSLETAVIRAEHTRELSRKAASLFATETGGAGLLSLYAVDPKTGAPVASVNASTPVVAASTYKL